MSNPYSPYPANSPYPSPYAGQAGLMQTIVVNEPIRPSSTSHIVIAWVLAVLTGFYMLPWAIAATRNHQSVVSIAVVNFFLGWTGIGWILTLIWACLGVQTRAQVSSVAAFGNYGYPQQVPPAQPIPGITSHPASNADWPQQTALPRGNPELAELSGENKTVSYETYPVENLPPQTWPQYRQPR